MAQRFQGKATNRLDDKFRVPVPPAFRPVLDAQDPDRPEGTQPRVHILYGNRIEPFLTCLSMTAYDEIDAIIGDMDEGDPELPALEAYYFGNAETVTLDSAWRIVINKEMRRTSGISDQAAFMGMRNAFRISPPDAPSLAVDPLEARLATMVPGQSPRSLLPRRRKVAVE